jgi:hypothetical protein
VTADERAIMADRLGDSHPTPKAGMPGEQLKAEVSRRLKPQ